MTAQSLLEDTYVDDIQGGGDSEADTVTFKEESTKILSEGGFSLHKWHSNVEHVNSSGEVHEGEETYAKSMVGNKQSNKTKILGTIDLETCLEIIKPLKMISTINSIYDILGWSASVTITAKLIFSEACLLKIYWDEEVPSGIQKKWESWVKRPSPFHARLHGPPDTLRDSRFYGCQQGCCLCCNMYVVAYQDSVPVDQNLFVAKARVVPKEMSIPRLELVAAHTWRNYKTL